MCPPTLHVLAVNPATTDHGAVFRQLARDQPQKQPAHWQFASCTGSSAHRGERLLAAACLSSPLWLVSLP